MTDGHLAFRLPTPKRRGRTIRHYIKPRCVESQNLSKKS